MQAGLNASMDSLAKRLRSARKDEGLTQTQLAQISGVKQSDISKIERGKIQKSTGLLALARALHRNPNWLDTGDGPEREITAGNSAHAAQEPRPPYVVAKGPAPLAATLSDLAGYFRQMDVDTKRMAVSLIGDLAKAPDTHGTVTLLIELAMSRAPKQSSGNGA